MLIRGNQESDMKRIALIAVLCLLPELAIGGLFYDGNKLYSGLGYCQEVQGRRFSGQENVGKAFSCERAIGYVMGVSDLLNETDVCQPTGLNSDQLRKPRPRSDSGVGSPGPRGWHLRTDHRPEARGEVGSTRPATVGLGLPRPARAPGRRRPGRPR